MASITSAWWMFACSGDGPADRAAPLHGSGPSDTAPIDATAETGSTGDTGPVVPPTSSDVRLFPEDRGDWAGRDLDAADLDGDGRTELLVDATWYANPAYGYGDPYEHSTAYLLAAPFEAGALIERAVAAWSATGFTTTGFARAPLILPASRQVGFAGDLHEIDSSYSVYDVAPKLPAGVRGSDTYVGFVDQHLLVDLGVTDWSTRCETPTGPALCLTGTKYVDLTDFSGHVLVYELPLVGAKPLLDFDTWLKGDVADHARTAHGDGDLDADGRADLVVGAYGWTEYTGRLAVLHELPPGEHRLWDVADATITAEVPGEEFGLSLATGDLDGDGYDDVLAGSPLGDGGAFLFLGPLAGDRLTSTAEVRVSGGAPNEWLGYGLALGDLTADGGADLAVGAPWSVYVEDAPPGNVFVFDDPRGALDVGDATWRLVSGVEEPDAFGLSVVGGDFDGDGYGDLAVGAPRDPTIARDAGSVTVFTGSSL